VNDPASLLALDGNFQTRLFKVGIKVDPFNIQIMNKPESEDEEAVGVNE